MKSDLELGKVRQIILEGLKGYSARVFLFGSRASGEEHKTSDIDVAVWPLATIPRHVFSDIRQALEDSNILPTVDLIDLSETDDTFRERVLKEGILWGG